MYHTEPPTDKTIREWYMNSNRVAACALRNEQAVRADRPGLSVRFAGGSHSYAVYNVSCINVGKGTDDGSQLEPKHVSVNKLIKTGVV